MRVGKKLTWLKRIFAKKVLSIPMCAMNRVAELERWAEKVGGGRYYIWQQAIGAELGRWARKKVNGSHTSGRNRILNLEVGL